MAKSVDNVNKAGAADEVFEALHEVMYLYRRGSADPAGPVARMEGRALAFFVRHPGATLSELAQHSGRDKSQLAKLVARLRELDLLEAQPDEEDRRAVRLHPTEKGLALQRELRQQHRQRTRLAVAGLSAEECGQLLHLMGRIRSNLEAGA